MSHRLLIAFLALCGMIAIGIWVQARRKSNASSNGENVSSNISINSDIERLSREVQGRRGIAEFWDAWNIRLLFVAGLAALLLAAC
jgi:hypothetical protein